MTTASASPAGPRDITDRDDVAELVVAFYRQAATDDLLGPVFEAARVDWAAHIVTLTDFWSWQLLGIPGYEGNPLRAHEPAHRRTPFAPKHYQRWLELFIETVDERFDGPIATTAKGRALRMARALERLLRDEHADGGAPIEVKFGAAMSSRC
ncbi:MAG TPA: group III truncated hemoglobin [Acidimicrobiia bacterium]|jgi:truncated hemoglobin YjbI